MKLKQMRKSLGLTQRQLADLSGLDIRKIQTYEGGSRPLSGARLDTLLRISIALECRLEDIIDDESTVQLLRTYAQRAR